jgi:hypothetical protein
MQLQINQGYMTIANQLIAPVAPVGYAWLTAWLQNPKLVYCRRMAAIPPGKAHIWQPVSSMPSSSAKAP